MIYEIDTETRELLEVALNWLAQVAELQATDEGVDGVYAVADSIAERFGIERKSLEVVEETDDSFTLRYTNSTEEDDGTVH